MQHPPLSWKLKFWLIADPVMKLEMCLTLGSEMLKVVFCTLPNFALRKISERAQPQEEKPRMMMRRGSHPSRRAPLPSVLVEALTAPLVLAFGFSSSSFTFFWSVCSFCSN